MLTTTSSISLLISEFDYYLDRYIQFRKTCYEESIAPIEFPDNNSENHYLHVEWNNIMDRVIKYVEG